MRVTFVMLGVIGIALAGCANINTVDRTTELPNGGKAVHLDAPQRLALVNKFGKMCSEPSPDAIQAYASSLGLGFGAPSKESVSLAQALSASAGSIGLRTQSITLMRDSLYRICELYYNGALDKNAALLLLERSQDLSLGILAIEQLTGAVVAQQVNINTNSAATAAASINDTQKELDRAKADEKAKKATADSTQAALDAQKKVVSEKTTEAATARANAKDVQAALDELSPTLIEAKTALDKSTNERIMLKSKVVGLQTKGNSLGVKEKEQKKQVDDLHAKAVAAEEAYQSAVKAVPKDQKKIDDLDVTRKAATAAETEANATLTQTAGELAKAKTELDTAKVAVKTADSQVNQAQDSVDQISAQIKALSDDPNQIAAEKAAAELKTAKDDQKKKQEAADEANKAFVQAQANTIEIEKIGNSAITSANATGGGAGSFSTSTSRYGVNKDTVEALAKATTNIVEMVMNKGRLTDSCAAMLFSYASHPKEMEGAMTHILPLCNEVFSAVMSAYRVGGSGPALIAEGHPIHTLTKKKEVQ